MTIPINNTLNIDKRWRFEPLIEMLGEAVPEGYPATVLDVGGYPGDLADFLKKSPWRVVTADLPECTRPKYVQASGTALPFKDDEFDAVVSTDTLEHIPEPERGKFWSECLRCARRAVVVCCPWGHPAVTYCEDTLRDLHGMLFPTPHPWLDEHGRHGLPELEEILSAIEAGGGRLAAIRRGTPIRPWFYSHAMTILSESVLALQPAAHAAGMIAREAAGAESETSVPYRLYMTVEKNIGEKKNLAKDSDKALKALMRLTGDEDLEWCRESAREFRRCAAGLKISLTEAGGVGSAVDAEAWAHRLERLTNETARELQAARRDRARLARRVKKLEGWRGYRLLKKFGLLE